ncbi:CBS domain-containing protein [uncultured Cocleimonas sp.]|uniref:CBS domain-containing protein n=1 Tax=uncultured Cocleimonas sp. TaxID=1051587 RepID=UPI00260CF846|nr:CBS domain-containing protein [uncultured Cocleimonas sp.]
MKKMNLFPLNSIEHLVQPEEFDEITLSSPAVSVFTDFKKHKPLMIESDISAVQAKYLMQKMHVRLQIAVDRESELLGTISLNQLSDQNLLIHQTKGLDREDLLVRHLMTPREEIMALEYKELLSSTIGDVVETLKKAGVRHFMVIEPNKHHIRGIISTSDIARRLHIPLDIETKNASFADLFNAIGSI